MVTTRANTRALLASITASNLSDDTLLPAHATRLNLDACNLEGFCQGFTAARHIDENIATSASEACRADFIKASNGHKTLAKPSITYENPTYGHIVTLLMPYSLPSRLGLLSYLSEYFFLHDDQEDQLDVIAGTDNEAVVDILQSKIARKRLLTDLLTQMLTVNQVQAQHVMKGLESYARIAARHRQLSDFESIEQYIEFRYDDYASEFILASTMWGMDMDPLDEEERQVMEPLIRSAYLAMALANDYFSYDVECVKSAGRPSTIMNGVAILERLGGWSCEDAKRKIKELSISFDQQFLHAWQSISSSGKLNPRLQRLAFALSYQTIGKVLWSSTSARYNAGHKDSTLKRTDSVHEVSQSDAALITALRSRHRQLPNI